MKLYSIRLPLSGSKYFGGEPPRPLENGEPGNLKRAFKSAQGPGDSSGDRVLRVVFRHEANEPHPLFPASLRLIRERRMEIAGSLVGLSYDKWFLKQKRKCFLSASSTFPPSRALPSNNVT